MRKKEIFLDNKKFNLFLERMEDKMTLNESEEKELLIEGVLDNWVKAAKNASIKSVNSMGKSTSEVSQKISKSFDDLINITKKVTDGINANLDDLSNIRTVIGVDAVSNIRNKLFKLVNEVINEWGFNPKFTKDLMVYMEKGGKLPNDLLKTLTNPQKVSIANLRKSINYKSKELIQLGELIKYAELVGNNPSILDLYSIMYSRGSVVSIEDFRTSWDILEGYATKSGNDLIKDIWYSIKMRLNNPKSSDDAITTLKNSIKDNEKWVTAKRTWIKKMKQFLTRKILRKVAEINNELNKGGIQWDLSLIYTAKDGDLLIYSARNKREFGLLKTGLEQNGISYRPLSSEGLTSVNLVGGVTNPKAENMAGKEIRSWWFKRIFFIGGPIAVGTGLVLWCQLEEEDRSDTSQENIDVSLGMNDNDEITGGTAEENTEKTFLEDFLPCFYDKALSLTKGFRDTGISLFKKTFENMFHNLRGGVVKYLNKKCGRISDEYQNGEWVEPCTKCVDCSADVTIAEIQMGDGKTLKEFYQDMVGDLDPNIIFADSTDPAQQAAKMKEIMDNGEDGIISKYLTKSGEVLDLEDMVGLICAGHRLSCLDDMFHKSIINFHQLTGLDCDGMGEIMEDEINFITKLKNEELLNWGEHEDKIDISYVKEHPDLNMVTSVETLITQLTLVKNEIVNSCNELIKSNVGNNIRL
ncbi:MAG: hypothetical protein ACW98X_20000 [Promethearchaeota archaeon]|jgi:hypothetical protein